MQGSWQILSFFRTLLHCDIEIWTVLIGGLWPQINEFALYLLSCKFRVAQILHFSHWCSEVVLSKPAPIPPDSGFCTRMILLSTKRYYLLGLQNKRRLEYQNDSAQNQTLLLVTITKQAHFASGTIRHYLSRGSEKGSVTYLYPIRHYRSRASERGSVTCLYLFGGIR